MSKVYVERAGNLGIDTAKNKTTILKTYLDSGKYARVRMFDDAIANLKGLLSLKDDYPDITFEAWLVSSQGSISTVR